MNLKEMMCIYLHGGHLLGPGSIFQLGYSPTSYKWEYSVECQRCGKISIVDKQVLDDTLYKDKDGNSKSK